MKDDKLKVMTGEKVLRNSMRSTPQRRALARHPLCAANGRQFDRELRPVGQAMQEICVTTRNAWLS